ncbi:CDGSH iron-sulfur domain-containing protein [Cupriavidus sp. CV2]|uniref:CDGSH iron-sulfur domain-containing protein n=1 Tax=Cupriavidus ulmosensis TaxID=3065913 RepID=UPI00296B53DA|nr:CDGSH iron-sulfur domain-containing protein [Cupriavidus sp. CV2]MDW3689119.1 CDGSH iron-sulfur domain-containing protein [Cupriavidus sp. CV2]
MSTAKIRVMNSGPLHVTGEFDLVDADGNRYPHQGIFSLCRCGKSACKPYCDGAHRAERWECTVKSDAPSRPVAS